MGRMGVFEDGIPCVGGKIRIVKSIISFGRMQSVLADGAFYNKHSCECLQEFGVLDR